MKPATIKIRIEPESLQRVLASYRRLEERHARLKMHAAIVIRLAREARNRDRVAKLLAEARAAYDDPGLHVRGRVPCQPHMGGDAIRWEVRTSRSHLLGIANTEEDALRAALEGTGRRHA